MVGARSLYVWNGLGFSFFSFDFLGQGVQRICLSTVLQFCSEQDFSVVSNEFIFVRLFFDP